MAAKNWIPKIRRTAGITLRGNESTHQNPAYLLYSLLSLLLLAPCFWQPRLEGGDLSGHIYNSWMTNVIEDGGTMGLAVVYRWTNILFDLLLSGLFRIFGAEAAQRIGVSLVV